MDTKYPGVVIGALSYVTVSFAVVLTWIFVAPISLLVAFTLEGLCSVIVGEHNHFHVATLSLIVHVILLIIACFWYYKILMKDKREKKEFNQRRLLVFYAILQFIVHPIGCYIWLFFNGGLYSDMPPVEEAVREVCRTIHFSGVFFVFLGLGIDLVWNKKVKESKN